MSRTLVVLALALSVSASAQQLPAVYQNYLRAAIQSASSEDNLERARSFFTVSEEADVLGATAELLLCQQFGQAWVAVQPKVASTRVTSEAGETATVAEFTEACQQEYTKALGVAVPAEEAKKTAGRLALGKLLYVGGQGNENKVTEKKVRESILAGGLGSSLLLPALELEVILQRFPEFKAQRLDVGLTPLGTGAEVQALNQAAVQRLIPEFQNYAKSRTAPTVERVIKTYTSMLEGSQKIDDLVKAKRYDEANITAIYVSELIQATGLPADRKELLALGITQTVSIKGKTIPFNSAVNAMYDLASQATTRARAANTADRQQAAAAAAGWKKAATAFKGDRARVFNFVGVPSSLSGQLMPSNSNISQSAKQMAGAARWYYRFRLRDGAESFDCDVTYEFKNDKLVAYRAVASPAYLDYQRSCEVRYSIR